MSINEIVNFAKSLSKYVVGAEGNFSVKYKEGFLIKASGSRFDTLVDEDLVYCDYNCNQLNNFLKKPSMEVTFHAYLQKLPNVNYVIHTHPVNILKIVCSDLIDKFAHTRFFPDQVVYNDKYSCVVPYAMPGDKLTKAIENSVNTYITEREVLPKAILLKNHGLICCGVNAKQCQISTEICEKSAEIFLSSITNNLNALSQNEIDEIDNNEMEKYRRL